jgi:hypothetical protein
MQQQIIDQLREDLPSVFSGTSLDKLTGNAVRWRTVQNRRSRREIPDECFVRSGTRVLVLRDKFLDWWATTLSKARSPAVTRAGRVHKVDKAGPPDGETPPQTGKKMQRLSNARLHRRN